MNSGPQSCCRRWAFVLLALACYGPGALALPCSSSWWSEWQEANSGLADDFYHLSYRNDRFLVFGNLGQPLLESADGRAWIAVGEGEQERAWTAGNGQTQVRILHRALLGEGGEGEFRPRLGQTTSFRGVAWGAGRFVAVGTEASAISSDGDFWTVQPMSTGALNDIAWDGIRFVAVGAGGNVATSANGEEWMPEISGSARILYSVYSENGLTIAVGAEGTVLRRDGASWLDRSLPVSVDLHAFTAHQDLWIAAGSDGAIFTSANEGDEWTAQNSGSVRTFNSVIWTGEQFVAGAFDTLLASPDGQTWSPLSTETYRLTIRDFIYRNGQLVLLGGGKTGVLPDGGILRWAFTEPREFLHGISWGVGRYVAVGDGGAILSSDDGVVWNNRTVEITGGFSDVIWTGDRFLAMGGNGEWSGFIFSSLEGVFWKRIVTVGGSAGGGAAIHSIARNGDLFVAVGGGANSEAFVMTSVNGENWTQLALEQRVPGLNSVVWAEEHFVAVGNFGAVSSSRDGVSWEHAFTGVSHALHGIGWNGESLVSAGLDATILTTSPPVRDLILSVLAENGTVAMEPGREQHASGECVQLKAAPAEGFRFAGWAGDLSSIENPATIVIDTNMVVEALFVPAMPGVSDRYNEWLIHFGEETDESRIGPFADFNDDGQNNFTKYAFGLDPRMGGDREAAAIIPLERAGGEKCVAVAIQLRGDDPALGHVLQTAQSLGSWEAHNLHFTGSGWTVEGDFLAVLEQEDRGEGIWRIVLDLGCSGESPARFVRVVARF